MPRRPSLDLAAVMVLAVAGCAKPVPRVPTYDFSQSAGYAVVPFKDDAPANATVSAAEFPLTFVDWQGRPVDLARYRGKKKVVLIVLRGMPRSENGAFCPSCLCKRAA